MDSTLMDSLQEHLDLLLAQSSSYREKGKNHIQKNNLVAARLCYEKALNYLVPKFESLKDDLLKKGFDINLSDCVSREIAMIFGNRSLVMLKEGDIGMARQDAQQSLDYFPTAKGYYRLAEARYHAGYYMDALQLFSESYSLEKNTVTYCKYFVLAVHIGHHAIILEPLDSYTPVIEKLITLHEFSVIHLEVLLLPKCKAVPKLKTGIAINKCSTACIKNLSEIMMETGWKLVDALIEHGTVPDIKCIEVATEKYGEDRTLYLTQCIEEKSKHNNICYNSLLSKAIRKKWNDRFVHHCLAKFAAEDVWTVLKKWSHDSRKHNLLKLITSQDGAMDIQNDKGQLPLDFLLEQGMFNVALVLLEFKIDCSGIDIIKTIKSVKKYKANRHPIFKILSGIIENKKQSPDLLIQELTSALKYAFTNNRYDVAAVLIDHGADIRSCVENFTTVVHVATKIALHVNERIGILKNVLDSYSFPEDGKIIDKNGRLPHHLAVADNTAHSEAVLKLLFQYSTKFDLQTKNKDGETALSCCRLKREHLKKLLEAEIANQSSVILQSSGSNENDNFQHMQDNISKQGTNSESTESAITKESTENHLEPPENKIMDDDDDETKLSMDQLTELVKRKIDSVLETSDHHLQEMFEYGHKLKVEPLKTVRGMHCDAVTITENTSRKEKEKTKERKRFEDCRWEVECTETFWKELSKQEKPLKEMAFSKLHRLANGEWHEKFHKPLSGTKCKKLYELKVDDSVRIIWERAIAYSPRLSLKDSSQNKPAELYTDVIRIWSLVIKHDNISTHVKHIETANRKGEDTVIKKKLSNHSKFRRERIPCVYRTDPATNNDNHEYFPPASAKDNEYNVVTFYSVSEGFIESILQHKDSRRDFPYKGWPKENEIINLSMDNSVLLLGRSGTGKTTCCLYRLWNQFKLYWEAGTDPRIQRISLIKPKPTTSIRLEASENEATSIDQTLYLQPKLSSGDEEKGSIDTCTSGIAFMEMPKLEFDDDVDSRFESDSCDDITSEDDEVGESDFKMQIVFDHLQQVFITKNSVLCAQFKKKFYDMAHTAKCLEGHLEFEKMPYPNALQNLDPRAFPLFLTTHQWLYLLDASLEDNRQFFPRNYDGSLAVSIFDVDDTSDAFTENLVMLDESSSEDEEDYNDKGHTIKQQSPTSAVGKLWKKVDSTYFCEVLWRKVAKGICNSKKVSPLLVWIEIKSFIKGSFQALQTPDGFLSFKEYCNLGHKMAPNFVGNREMIYKLFEKYEIVKKQMQHRHYDDGDLVFNLFQRLSRLDDINWCIHQFYIDEVQDFTQAELTLLLHCCRWPNGLFLTGDTAQSIMRGVSFRFSDLRSVFYYISKHVDRSRGQKVKLRVPQLHTLTQNFRSHSGILQLAASVIDLLMYFFRSSLDKLPRDQGMFPGPKPVLLSCDFNDLVLLLKGNRREASAIEFGAKQAIIVQSEETKKYLSNKIKAIVLTVFESKGLEFDDVLLYNFFSDSKVTEEWKAVINYLDENPKLIVNHEKVHKPQPLRQFDECQHKALNSELKILYTAITRARCNLWIYDSNPDKHAPMFYYFKIIDLVRVLPKSDSDKKGTEHMDHLMFTKVSTPEDWKRQGDHFRLRKVWKTAIFCYEKAGIIELVNETKGDYNMWMARKENQKQHYLQATLNYLRDFDIKPSVKRINKAATCLYNACKYELSAALFLKIHEVDLAVKAYVKGDQYETAAKLYLESNEIEKAIKILLLDKQGKSLPYALKLALEYNQILTFEQGCSVNIIAQRTAEYYLQNNNIKHAVACVEYFSEVRDKISLFKKVKFINEAIQMLFTNEQYDDLYHLLKGQGCFERGAEIAEKLNNNETHCEFLLLLIKKKLSTAQYAEEDRHKDAKMLEEANDRLCDDHETLKLQVELICGILKQDPLACFNVCRKFITINKFGAIEALNVAINFKKLNLDKIIVIVDCLRFANDVISNIEKTEMLTLKHLELQCRKFYQFEQSEGKFFLPPCQFYWIPNLEKFSLAERDNDGMIQFDEVKVYELLKTHLNNVIHKWMLLDLEKVLFSMITSNKYKTLNSVLDKQLDIQKFAKRSYDISIFVICCIKLIEIAHFHDGKSIKSCDIKYKIENIKISKWGELSDYASIRLFYVFSPEWCYYFTFSKEDIRMIKESKIICNLLFTMLHSDEKVKTNINSFLENWRILKLTGCDASTLVKCLKNEEAEFMKKVSKEKSKNEQSNVKQNTKKTNQSQLNEAMFIQNDSNYSHIFFAWLHSCRCLENINFMGFAGGVIEQLFILIAERESFKPKITVLNITYVLEIISIGLFGSLQAALVHMNRRKSIPLLFPKFYEHLVTSFDPINFTPQAFLDIVATSVVNDKNFKQINEYSLYLLQKILYLLLGKIEPSFNVLRYASKTDVYKNGFERCLVLCLSLLGNLWSLLHKQYLSEMLSILKSNVSCLPSDIIKDKFPELFANLQHIQEIKNSDDVFSVLLSIQKHSHSYMVCIQYQYDTDVKGRFSFSKMDPEQFLTFAFRSSKHIIVQNAKQRQQQHHERSNRPVVALQHLTTSPVLKFTKHKAVAVKQRSQKIVPNDSYTLPQTSDVTPSDENATTNQQTLDVKDMPEAPFDENANQEMYMSSVKVASDAPIDENAANYFGIQPLSRTDSLTEEKIVIPTSPEEQTLHSCHSDTTNMHSTVPTDSLQTCSNETFNTACPEAPISSSQTEPVDRTITIDHNQATREKQNHVDKRVETDLHSSFQQDNSKAPLFVSSVDSTEAEPTEDFHSLLFPHVSENEATNTITEFQSTPLATPVVYTDLSGSHSVETTETIVPSTPMIDHQTTHATLSNVVKNNDVLFQSDLKPDVESTLKTDNEHHFLSNNSGQVRDLSLQAAYQQTMYQIANNPNIQVYHPGYAMPVPPIPLTATYPLTSQLMYVPVIPNPYLPSPVMNPLSYYYAYGYDASSASSNFQEPQHFLPSGDIDPNPITNYCTICGKSIDVEQSNSTEHHCNMKAYTAYQEIKNQYSKLFEDVENVINSRDAHMGIQAQIDKIKERKGKFERENSQVEDNFAWLNGQSLIQCYAKEVDLLLKEYNESLRVIKDALD